MPTSTSAFGVGRRENHDASGFYARFTPPVVRRDGQVAPERVTDVIVCGDARKMDAIPDDSVALVVTSPPYFAGKAYEEALGDGGIPASYAEYLDMLADVFAECVRVLEPGGRIAVNVANLGRKPYRSLAADVTAILQDRLGLLMRGEIIWQKARGAGGNCAWGSFQQPGNPVLRDLTERIVVASKHRFDRALSAKERQRRGLPHVSTLRKDDFFALTTDVWEFPTESATRVGHPAPFPLELPERLILLYTYAGDLVLDPFMGSGTTAVAAVRTGRHYAGYDTDPDYVAAAHERVAAAAEEPGLDLPALAPGVDGEDLSAWDAQVTGGEAIRRLAHTALAEAGLTITATDVNVGAGISVPFATRTATGREVLVDVGGSFTTHRPGLLHNDDVWRALGRATVIAQLRPEATLIVVTTHVPTTGPVASMLAAASAEGGPLAAVVAVLSESGRLELSALAAT